jgi:hypothetical protein
MAILYDVSVPAISQHLKTIFADSELQPEATVKKFLIVQTEGRDYPAGIRGVALAE